MSMAKRRSAATSTEPRIFAAVSPRDHAELRAAKQDLSRRLLARDLAFAGGVRALPAAISPAPAMNVVGVGIGEEVVENKPNGRRALKVFVRVKYPRAEIRSDHLLPDTHAGYAVDVEQVGLFRAFQRKKAKPRQQAATDMPDPRVRVRPAQPGCSIGFQDPNGQFRMAGTFGALVQEPDSMYILSNNHVLANENQLAPGAPIFQPGLLDDPNADQLAELTRFQALQADGMNKVDCALAKPLKPGLVTRDILYIGVPNGVAPAAVDMVVHKFGRTTSYTVGRVTSTDTDVTIQYEMGALTFEGQIIIAGLDGQAFSAAGDSGSAILERQSQNVIGLLFAGSSSHTIANHIEDVLQALGVSLA
jgi:hypothetical protein